ncbi:YdaU family protein [Rhizobium bangladeshense]|uniref:YdaU family protein n=1 Tax=Rhizobium bangladeshense TaxID=1138189 RepID=UPI0035C93C0F
MQLYVSDFIGDTLSLSTEQIGAYMLLLMAMWNAGGRLPADEAKLARVARMSVKKWKAIADDLMAFFEVDGEFVRHNRLTKELLKSESKSQSRSAAGAEGGRAKALKDKDARIANAMPSPRHLPETITRLPSEDARAPVIDPDFERFWDAYPNKTGRPSAEQAFSQAIKRASLDEIMAGVAAYAAKTDDRQWCSPVRWLSDDRWKDQPAKPPDKAPPKPNGLSHLQKFQTREEYLAAELARSERSFR